MNARWPDLFRENVVQNSVQRAYQSLSRQAAIAAVAQISFATLLVLTLGTPSWRAGPFTWWPLWRSPMLAGRPADLGLLSLLPGIVAVGCLGSRLMERPRRRWCWGRHGVTLPLVGLTALDLASLDSALTWRTIVQVVGLLLFWLVYLFVVNERPNLMFPLALVTLIQGGIAVGQFLRQSDLGLASLGELSLDPTVSGISVLWARGQRWLRGYGLTAHPNFLGATLTIALLLLLPALPESRARRRAGLAFVAAVGSLGLLTSFSRASWLSFVVGLFIWIKDQASRPKIPRLGLLLLLVPLLFLLLYRDVVMSRFLNLDTALEARSLDERWRDARLTLELILAHPWRGVGTGNQMIAARVLDPHAVTVHNVPLLVAAEMGLPGLALWLWLTLSGLRSNRAAVPAWVAMLVVGLFDNTLWLTTSWRSAILVALVAAGVSGSRSEVKGQPGAG